MIVDELTSCLFCGKQWRTCRDRRPRLSTHLPLYGIPLGNIPSFGGAWGGFFLAVFWRTDEGVCPYRLACYLNKRNAFFNLKRAFPCNEESLSSHRRNAPFIRKQKYSLPSPFGEGVGVRLLLSSSGRLAGVLTFGEGAGVRLLLPSLGGVGEVLTLIFSITANVKKKLKKVWSVH